MMYIVGEIKSEELRTTVNRTIMKLRYLTSYRQILEKALSDSDPTSVSVKIKLELPITIKTSLNSTQLSDFEKQFAEDINKGFAFYTQKTFTFTYI